MKPKETKPHKSQQLLAKELRERERINSEEKKRNTTVIAQIGSAFADALSFLFGGRLKSA